MSDTPDVTRENIEQLIAECSRDVRIAGTAKGAALREHHELTRKVAEATKALEAAEAKFSILCRKWATLQEMSSLFVLENLSR